MNKVSIPSSALLRKLLTDTMRARLSADGRKIIADLEGLKLALATDRDLSGADLYREWRKMLNPSCRMLFQYWTGCALKERSPSFIFKPADWAWLRRISTTAAGKQVKNALASLARLGFEKNTAQGARFVYVMAKDCDCTGHIEGRDRVFNVSFSMAFYESFINPCRYHVYMPPEIFAADLARHPGAFNLYRYIAECFQMQSVREWRRKMHPITVKGGTLLAVIGIYGSDAQYNPVRKMRAPLEGTLNHLKALELIRWDSKAAEGRSAAQRVKDTVYSVMPLNAEFIARVNRLRAGKRTGQNRQRRAA